MPLIMEFTYKGGGTAVFSVGSDGTDGSTDAAGGWCDGVNGLLREKKIA